MATIVWVPAARPPIVAALTMPNGRALPEGFEVLWGSIEAGALHGRIAQTGGGEA